MFTKNKAACRLPIPHTEPSPRLSQTGAKTKKIAPGTRSISSRWFRVSANNGGCRPHKVAVIYIWQHWLHIFYTAIAYRIKNNA